MDIHNIDVDCFSSGQIQSKIWLVSKLELAAKEHLDDIQRHKIWILAGWYGITNFILRSRDNLKVSEVRSFDVDPSCEIIADKINNLWEWQAWQFKAHTRDINSLEYNNPPTIVINSSVEHVDSTEWFDRIPTGTFVCLQASDLAHDDHIVEIDSLEKLKEKYPLKIVWEGMKRFEYDNLAFNRYMTIGFKLDA
jgi:hypothetical protein